MFNKAPVDLSSVILKVKLENRTTTYLVQNDGLLERAGSSSASDDIKTIVSFLADDHVITSEDKISDKDAKSLLARSIEINKTTKLINDSENGFIYAHTMMGMVGEIDQSINIFPLLQLLNKSFENSEAEKPEIYGYKLGKPGAELILLFGQDKEGNLKINLLQDSDSLDDQMLNFAHALNTNQDFKSIVYTHQEFFEHLALSSPYPNKNTVYGMNPDLLWAGAALVSILSVAAAGGLYWYKTNQIKNNKESLSSLEYKKSEINSQTASILSQRVPSVIERSSVRFNGFLVHAQELWVQSSYLESEIDKKGETHIIHLPINKTSETTGNDIQDLYNITPPEGCVLTETKIEANLNEINSTYYCQNTDSNSHLFSF